MYDYKYCAVAGSQRSVSQMSVNTHRNPVIPAVCMRTLPRYESLFVRFTMRAPLTLSAEFRKVFLTKKRQKKTTCSGRKKRNATGLDGSGGLEVGRRQMLRDISYATRWRAKAAHMEPQKGGFPKPQCVGHFWKE